MSDVLQVVTTASSQAEAQKIAEALVKRRLAACVQVMGPITSSYHWKGALQTAQEWQCVAKTRKTHYEALAAAIAELHSYDVPEVLAFEVAAGSRAYVDWLTAELIDLSGPQIA
jgi:periplasmic divalent cation tolerance protein